VIVLLNFEFILNTLFADYIFIMNKIITPKKNNSILYMFIVFKCYTVRKFN